MSGTEAFDVICIFDQFGQMVAWMEAYSNDLDVIVSIRRV